MEAMVGGGAGETNLPRGWRESIEPSRTTFSFNEGKLKSGLILVLVGGSFAFCTLTLALRELVDREWLIVAFILFVSALPLVLIVGGLIQLFNRVQIAITGTELVQTSGPILRTTKKLTLEEAKTIMLATTRAKSATTTYFTALKEAKTVRLPGNLDAVENPTWLLAKISDSVRAHDADSG